MSCHELELLELLWSRTRTDTADGRKLAGTASASWDEPPCSSTLRENLLMTAASMRPVLSTPSSVTGRA